MLILYGVPVSTFTTKVRIALHAKGIDFVEQAPPGGYRSEAWRAIIPTGTIPAIDHNGFVLAESEAIIEYVDEAFNGPSLLPGDAQSRACARMLARVHDLAVEPAVRALFPLIRDPARRDALPALADALHHRLTQLERLRGADSAWMAGPDFSTADCGFAVTLPLAQRLLQALGRPRALPASLEGWLARSTHHAAVAAGLAPWRPATEAWLAQAMGAQS
jgi:glutathione S-transferase